MFDKISSHAIVYELLSEHANGQTVSRFFNESNVLKSRQMALQSFLRLFYEEQQVVLLTLYVRHFPSHQRVELINSMTYGSFWELARGLEKELEIYETEKLACFIAIINSEKENVVSVYWPRTRFHHLWKTKAHSFMLYQDYWLFTCGRKNEEHLPY